ncbi:Isochorismatase domain-containing protein [Trichoderma simmonsii]|uniref:Isochorismatase domain-containing protein n=1 Tax=Trichoderma simmonsii TaxID=1491479 RepID=A0A8G0LQP2_9HYPO|nr:Isochorismatase domain-containing protein [Trichoderma simmonsii]
MSSSPFFIPVDLAHTALLLSDVQTQILKRFSPETQKQYLDNIKTLLGFFRDEISQRRSNQDTAIRSAPYEGVPLIVHHTLPFNINSNSFASPYNKLSKWVKQLEDAGYFANAPSDPHHPYYGIPDEIVPPGGWGGKDEIVLGKLQPSCFGTSDLQSYLRARGIRHVVLVGLTTMGSILGSARAGADLDYHIICVEEGIVDDDPEIHKFLMSKILPKFVDVVELKDILGLQL